jgi:hypothetical protein
VTPHSFVKHGLVAVPYARDGLSRWRCSRCGWGASGLRVEQPRGECVAWSGFDATADCGEAVAAGVHEL